MNNSLVSIIIPTYNRADLIGETLDSIIAQTYNNWECIVIDDGSTDSTSMLLGNYMSNDHRIKYHLRPQDRLKGACSCRNYGFKLSKGIYINWFDDDDVMHPDFIKKKVDFFKENEMFNCVISKTQFFKDTINTIIGKEERTYNSENLLEDFVTLKRSWYVCDSMWRKDFLKNKNIFSTVLLKGQDRDFHTRMLMDKNLYIGFLDRYLVYYRQHNNTISNNFSKKVAESIHKHTQDRFIQLKKYEVSNEILMFIHKQILKNYKYIKSNEFNFYTFLLKNRINSILFYKWLIKFTLSVISFKIFNKGGFFLKG